MLFNRKKKILNNIKTNFKRIYQYSDGTYLPDSFQPDPEDNYEIHIRENIRHASTRYIHVDNNCKKNLPELYTAREKCCGCTACYAICPVQAIVMRPCEEGFLYPVVNAEKCIGCQMCMNTCPIKKMDGSV